AGGESDSRHLHDGWCRRRAQLGGQSRSFARPALRQAPSGAIRGVLTATVWLGVSLGEYTHVGSGARSDRATTDAAGWAESGGEYLFRGLVRRRAARSVAGSGPDAQYVESRLVRRLVGLASTSPGSPYACAGSRPADAAGDQYWRDCR